MKKKTKGIIIILLAIVAYPIPGVPSTILIILGAKMISDYKKQQENQNENR